MSAEETGTRREHASGPVGTSNDASLVERARAWDGNAFRTITPRRYPMAQSSFDFDHKTKHGRRAGADRRPSGFGGGG